MTWIDIVMMTISIGITSSLIAWMIVFVFLCNKHVFRPLKKLSKLRK